MIICATIQATDGVPCGALHGGFMEHCGYNTIDISTTQQFYIILHRVQYSVLYDGWSCRHLHKYYVYAWDV